MAKRARTEPLWPLGLALALVAGGVALGTLLTAETTPDDPARALEAVVDDGLVADIPTPWDRIRVEVLNGGGITGAAAAAKDRLRDEGFDVVYYGNAPSFGRETSVILVRTDEEDAARAVGGALGVSGVRSEPDTTLLVDVTVLLGTDWGTGEGAELMDDGRGERSWWDPKRYLGRYLDSSDG